jgi:hypothetical protein
MSATIERTYGELLYQRAEDKWNVADSDDVTANSQALYAMCQALSTQIRELRRTIETLTSDATEKESR